LNFVNALFPSLMRLNGAWIRRTGAMRFGAPDERKALSAAVIPGRCRDAARLTGREELDNEERAGERFGRRTISPTFPTLKWKRV